MFTVYNSAVTVLLCVIMFLSRTNRYIIAEVMAPTLICLLVFTMVLLMGRMMKLVDLVVNKGVSVLDIATLLGTMLPTFLNITLPLAFLMGIMIGLSRMSADSEAVALKAAGIGLGQIARPILILALVFSLLSGVAGIWLKPWGYASFRNQIFELTMKKATIGFQEQVFMRHFDNLVLYANDIDDQTGTMSGLFIVEKQPDSSMLFFADQGNIITDQTEENVTIQLRNGALHRQDNKESSAYQLIHFQDYNVQPKLQDEAPAGRKQTRSVKTKEISTIELWRQIKQSNGDSQTKQLPALRAELHERLVSPLTPIIFALFALPFSIQSHRSGRSGGFAIGLLIYLCYYMILSLAQTFTAEASVPPTISFWLPHLLLIICGTYGLKQSAEEKPNFVLNWLENIFAVTKNKLKKLDEYS